MVRDLFVLLCLSLVVQIVRSSPDSSRTRKSHKGREAKHQGDSRRDEGVNLRGHKKQTRIKVGHKRPPYVPKGQSKENDNLEHVLFDREKLKKYVLDYLRKHHGYVQAEKTITGDEEESISRKTEKLSVSYHRDRLDSQISSINGKHKHLYDRLNKNPLHSDRSTHKWRKLNSKQKSHHQTHSQNHLDKHKRSKKLALPIYYNVKEEGSKRTYIWPQPLSSDHKAKRRKSRIGGKHSSRKNKISTKRDAGIESNVRTHKKVRRYGNQNSKKLSPVRALPYSRHHGKSKYKKGTGHKKQAGKYTDEHKDNGTDHKANGRSHRKSNKRDFIAVVPPKTLRIEGFDVEPVHPDSSQHIKRKKALSVKHRHIHEKKNKLHKYSEDQRVGSKGNKASTSHRHEHDSVRTTSQSKKTERKSKVLPRISRKNRKKVSVHKSSREQKAARKSSVRSAHHKGHPHKHKHHDRGYKKSTVDKKEKSTAHRRKKKLKFKDSQIFSPSWKSLDKRAIPSWYDDAKFGIFVHWGVYSVPSFDSEWFWYKWKGRQLQQYLNYTGKNFPPGFSYNEFAPMFKAEFFDAKQWAKLVARSGARYFVFTSKHHEGFTNWNSSAAWNWNSVDIGPHRNLVDELARAFRSLSNPQVRFGLYYSLFEWFNPHYLKDKANGFKTDGYIQAVVKPQLYDLVNTYKPDYLWTDGDWEAEASYWKSKEFLAWLFNKSPVKDKVVINDRWGRGCRCHHGGVYTGQDRYNPGKLQKIKWENAMTIDRHSWGFRREANLIDYLKIEELITQLASTVSCGGNLLMNIGPAADGTIAPIFQERLTQMGDWLKVNGDAIYGTRPWRAQNDSVTGDVWYTSKDNHVFAIALKWPRAGRLVLGDPTPTSKTLVRMLGTKKDLKWTHGSQHKGGKQRGIIIHVPVIPVSELPCLWAWVFKLSHLK